MLFISRGLKPLFSKDRQRCFQICWQRSILSNYELPGGCLMLRAFVLACRRLARLGRASNEWCDVADARSASATSHHSSSERRWREQALGLGNRQAFKEYRRKCGGDSCGRLGGGERPPGRPLWMPSGWETVSPLRAYFFPPR